jgi:hypothetical protein
MKVWDFIGAVCVAICQSLKLQCACSQKSAKLTAPNGLKAVFIYSNSAHVVYRVQLSGDSGFESPAGNYMSSLPSCWPNGKAPDYGALFLPRRLFIRVLWSLSARAKGSQGWRTSFSPSRGKSSVVHLSALFKLVLQLCWGSGEEQELARSKTTWLGCLNWWPLCPQPSNCLLFLLPLSHSLACCSSLGKNDIEVTYGNVMQQIKNNIFHTVKLCPSHLSPLPSTFKQAEYGHTWAVHAVLYKVPNPKLIT